MWRIFALLSAVFAAMTAIFAKIGIKNVDTDLATAIRTVVILILAWAIAFYRGGTSTVGSLTKHNLLFLVLSGIATGLSWIFYFKALQLGQVSQVASVDKLSVALVIDIENANGIISSLPRPQPTIDSIRQQVHTIISQNVQIVQQIKLDLERCISQGRDLTLFENPYQIRS